MREASLGHENGGEGPRSLPLESEPARDENGIGPIHFEEDDDGSSRSPSRTTSVALSSFLGLVSFAAILVATRTTAWEMVGLGRSCNLLSSMVKSSPLESDSTSINLDISEGGIAPSGSCAVSGSRRPPQRFEQARFRRFRRLLSRGGQWWNNRLRKRERAIARRWGAMETAASRSGSSASSALLKSRFPTAYTVQPIRVSADEARWIAEFEALVARSYESDPSGPVGSALLASNRHLGLISSMRVAVDGDWRSAACSPRLAWGGGGVGDEAWDPAHLAWWDPPHSGSRRHAAAKHAHEDERLLDQLDGGYLLHSYLKIMRTVHEHRHHNKKGSESEFRLDHVCFPLQKCARGCPASESIRHTLTWRAYYRPWQVDGSVVRENERGWIYAQGWGTCPEDDDLGPTSRRAAPHSSHVGRRCHRHAILWARPGIHRAVDGSAWMRTVLHGADLAVAQALRASSGELGKFNVIIDVSGFEWGRTLPSLSTLQQTVSALQDHFPNRLGAVAVLNLGRAAEIVVNMIKPWLTKEVREKIHVVTLQDLSLLVEPDSIPAWLDGPDPFIFNVDKYYTKRVRV